MKRNFVVLFVAVNVLVVAFGGCFVCYDLYLREYSTRTHDDTAVIEVEYSLLMYRPTYEYYENRQTAYVVSKGSWTLDCFQLSIVIAVIGSLSWHLSRRQNKEQTE
jgi:hypothetical protein